MEQTLSKGEIEMVVNELWRTNIQQIFSSDYNDTNYNKSYHLMHLVSKVLTDYSLSSSSSSFLWGGGGEISINTTKCKMQQFSELCILDLPASKQTT